jgi:hypothetical protein
VGEHIMVFVHSKISNTPRLFWFWLRLDVDAPNAQIEIALFDAKVVWFLMLVKTNWVVEKMPRVSILR